ncbi:RDD family protein [Janibacter sp. G1551]|uniref:RDD family protein n=1 Tax=Janibacter sp. G1551 TaxID=3420440 RepID=UPI003CFCAEE7
MNIHGQAPGHSYGPPPRPERAPVPPGYPPVAPLARRTVARLIDVVLVLAAITGIILWVGALPIGPLEVNADGSQPDPEPFFLGLAGIAAVVVLPEIILVATLGATIGKLLTGLRVIDVQTLRKPSWGSSLLRWLLPHVGLAVCLPINPIIWGSALFDGSGARRGWHDRAANTVVVRR